ncbi:MAG: hypothetical protein QXM16_07850 [Nitrososphaerota archaeon]
MACRQSSSVIAAQSLEHFYTASIKLSNKITGTEITLAAILDSGFGGYVMVTRETYQALELSLMEAHEDQFPTHTTMARAIVLRTSLAQVEIAENPAHRGYNT